MTSSLHRLSWRTHITGAPHPNGLKQTLQNRRLQHAADVAVDEAPNRDDLPPRFEVVRVRAFAGLRAADFFPRVSFFLAGAFVAAFFRATAFFLGATGCLLPSRRLLHSLLLPTGGLLLPGAAPCFAAFFTPTAFFFRALFFFRTAITGSSGLSLPRRSTRVSETTSQSAFARLAFDQLRRPFRAAQR